MAFISCIAVALLLAVVCAAVACASDATVPQRETVLDRQTHISPDLLPVPEVAPLCDTIPGLTKQMVDIGDAKIYCEIEGKGTPMVLVSGGPGCSHHIFHPSFSSAASFAQVIYYDQRGVGQSSQDSTGNTYTLKQAVEDLDRLRAALGIDKWVVLGHSYGGLLAQCYALEHPEHVLGLVLVCSSTGVAEAESGGTRQFDFLTQEERAKISWAWGQQMAAFEQRIYNAHWNGDWKRQNFYRPTDAELARMARYEWLPAPGFRERISRDLNLIDLQELFSDFKIPTLLLEARWDLTWSALKPHAFKQNHSHGQLIVFEHSGHSPYVDEPDRFFSVLDSFVARAAAAPPPDNLPTQRIAWPPPVIFAIMALPWFGAGEQAKPLLQQAKDAGLADASAWLGLGLRLYDGEAYPEAMECFERINALPKATDLYRFAALVWQGHILDLQGKRQQALARYRKALKINIGSGGCMEHSQYGIYITLAWAKERLKTPFDRQTISLSTAIEQLPWIGACEQAKPLLTQAKETGLTNARSWLKLGLMLYDGASYPEAIEAFQKLEALTDGIFHFAAVVWQGHILDLQGKREQALNRYHQALKVVPETDTMRHDQYGIFLDRAWVEERLKTPFVRK